MKPIAWSDGGQILFLDDWAWGVDEHGDTVALDSEENMRKLLESRRLTDNEKLNRILWAENESLTIGGK